MTKSYQIKINQGKTTEPINIPQAGPNGQAVTVKALAGARYQLIDPETGFSPENIRASRQGKDLKVSFEGSKTTDLVIEDYYAVSPEGYNGLVGEAESGRFYEYIPENASGLANVPMLADSGQAVGMALGGAEVTPAGAAVGVLAAGLFSPGLLGAGALGVAAAAGGGGGGGSSSGGSGSGGGSAKPNGGNALGLKVDLDGNIDGVINGSEKGISQTTTLTANFDKTKVTVGDKVVFSDGIVSKDVVLTTDDVAAGKVTSSGWALPAEDGSKIFTAVLTDVAGSSTPKAEQAIKLDAITESLKTALSIDPITLNKDNVLSVSEQVTPTVSVTGKVTGAFAAGDLVSLSINGQTFTGNATGDGSYSIKIPVKDLQADADLMLEGHVTGSSGGQLATASQSYSVETSANVGKTTALFMNPISMDNILNFDDIKLDSSIISGQVTGKFAADDTVSLLVHGNLFKGTVNTDGTYSIPVQIQDLLADSDTTVDAFVTGTGGTSAKAMQNYGIDTQAPVLKSLTIDLDTSNKDGLKEFGDGWINKTEMGESKVTSLTATFDKNTVSVGDVITFVSDGKFSDGTNKHSITIDQKMVEKGFVTSEDWSLPSENVQLNVTAVIKDAAGNTSTTLNDAAVLDTAAIVFKEPVLNGATSSVFTSVTFKPEPLNGVLEKGSYTLHVGDKTLDWILQTTPGSNNVSLKTVVGLDALAVKGDKIYLECWDEAGNHSESGLLSSYAETTWQLAANTQFIV